MNKFTKYIGIPHNYKSTNCLTFLEYIYINDLNIDFSDIRSMFILEVEDLRSLLRTDPEAINLFSNWKKINLTDLKEYDILVFNDSKGRLNHFGLYIGNNRFIHSKEKSLSSVSELNEDHRKFIKGSFRHRSMDR